MVETPHGPARVMVEAVAGPRGTLVLGHGAGGGVGARDLQAAVRAANEVGLTAALVEQPYRVAGRRSQPPARQLDEAWTAVIEALGADALAGLPVVVGGRSAGARVACRTAARTGAVGVLCLAFPLVPPRSSKSRQEELDAVDVPVLVIQGASDQFGVPLPAPGREVVVLRGTHTLTSDLDGVAGAVRDWLPGLLTPGSRRRRSPASGR